MSVHDVAALILREHGAAMTAMKLQKLVYYAQAWSLVWDERPLFNERIEAWANGPVAPDLYDRHRGAFLVAPGQIEGNPDAVDADGLETVRAVLEFYGHRTASWLSDLTHRERPWLDAREGLQVDERGNVEITQAAMAEYYEAIQ